MYPFFFFFENDNEEEPEFIKAWADCGVTIEIKKKGGCLIKINVPYIDEFFFRDIPKLESFVTHKLPANHKDCIIYDNRNVN